MTTIAHMEENKTDIKTVATASLVGTAIEWYDFFIFSSLTPLVFNKLFFPFDNPLISDLLAYATFAAGFIVRPLGGIVFGHFGDRIGRKRLLVLTLTLMGLGTFLIGLLPTYSQIGIWAPIILLALRVMQGLALGGEWGGAVLMAFEFAKPGRRALYSSIPQIGLALGLAIGTGGIALLSGTLSNDTFLSWGWRLPFLASCLLLGVGLYIRARIAETPEFDNVKKEGRIARVPFVEVLAHYKTPFVLGLGVNLIMGLVFSVYCVFGMGLMVKSGAISRTGSLSAVSLAAVMLLFTIPLSSLLADRIGTKKVFVWASIASGALAFPILWVMLYSGNPLWITLAILVGFGCLWGPLYGLQSSIYCVLFDARLRYTGISLVYQLGSVLSISLTPIVAASLFAVNGTPLLIGTYMVIAAVIGAVSVKLMNFKSEEHHA
ncbi:MAG TPA: MFS transporter [Kofleriaceae bacterium]|jgi:MFS family permease|nr:MFS transporter [Kofleriaceae bacterium]